MRQYGVQIPVQVTASTAAVTVGDLTITLPAGVAAEAVMAVRNVAGTIVPRVGDRVVRCALATGAARSPAPTAVSGGRVGSNPLITCTATSNCPPGSHCQDIGSGGVCIELCS